MTASCISVLFLIFSLSTSAEPPITAQHGDDVILSCEAPNYVTIVVVEWIRSDLKRHVYLKRDGHMDTADQDPSYVNRVQLKNDEMKNGELSLILKNVNKNDTGRYECRYLEETGHQIKFISIVYLDVEGGDSESGKDTEGGHLGVILSVTLFAALVVGGLVGFVIYKQLKGRSEKKPDLPVDDPDVQQLQENKKSEKHHLQQLCHSDTEYIYSKVRV